MPEPPTQKPGSLNVGLDPERQTIQKLSWVEKYLFKRDHGRCEKELTLPIPTEGFYKPGNSSVFLLVSFKVARLSVALTINKKFIQKPAVIWCQLNIVILVHFWLFSGSPNPMPVLAAYSIIFSLLTTQIWCPVSHQILQHLPDNTG